MSKNDKDEEKKVKQLNQEIMQIFEKHTASFGHASASLLSVLYFITERYTRQHPENKPLLLQYFKTEFDRFLNKLSNEANSTKLVK